MRQTTTCLATLVLGIALGQSQAEAETCEASSAAERYPSAMRAVSTWEAANKVRLLGQAKDRLLVDLCAAAVAAATNPKHTPEKMAAASATAVKDHLDRELDPSSPPRMIGAALRSALGVSGFSRPSNRWLGIVDIKGDRGRIKLSAVEAESKRKTEEEHAAPIMLFLAPGTVTVQPLANDRTCKCEDPCQVQAGKTTVIRCLKL